MLIDEKTITIEEYMRMPIGASYQYINGTLVNWPSRTPTHQSVLGYICMVLANYRDRSKNKGWFVMGPIETILDDKNSFQPDFAYIAADRSEIVKDYIYGAPDLIVKILHDKNAYYDLRPKKDTYQKHGVKEYIIIDPIQENADLYALKDGIYYLHQKAQKFESLNSLVLPGLFFNLSEKFRYQNQ